MPRQKKRDYRAKRAGAKRRSSRYHRRALITRPIAMNSNMVPATTAIAYGKGPLAATQKCTFVYTDNFQLAPTSGVSSYVFTANGLYDPNFTGIGHQPRGYDEMLALYDHAVVIHTKATLLYSNGNGTEPCTVAMTIRDSPGVVSDTSGHFEHRNVSAAVAGPRASGTGCGSLDIKVNPNRFMGRSKPLSDPELKNRASQNPTEQCYIHVAAQPLYNNLDATVNFRIRIEYEAILLEPKSLNSS